MTTFGVDVFTEMPVHYIEVESNPIDVDDPVAVSQRLGEIEDKIAVLAPKLAYALGRLIELKSQRRRIELSLWPGLTPTRLAKDREAQIQAMMESKAHVALEDALVACEAHAELWQTEMRALEKRMSALQSALKSHPVHGPGYGQGGQPQR